MPGGASSRPTSSTPAGNSTNTRTYPCMRAAQTRTRTRTRAAHSHLYKNTCGPWFGAAEMPPLKKNTRPQRRPSVPADRGPAWGLRLRPPAAVGPLARSARPHAAGAVHNQSNARCPGAAPPPFALLSITCHPALPTRHSSSPLCGGAGSGRSVCLLINLSVRLPYPPLCRVAAACSGCVCCCPLCAFSPPLSPPIWGLLSAALDDPLTLDSFIPTHRNHSMYPLSFPPNCMRRKPPPAGCLAVKCTTGLGPFVCFQLVVWPLWLSRIMTNSRRPPFGAELYVYIINRCTTSIIHTPKFAHACRVYVWHVAAHTHTRVSPPLASHPAAPHPFAAVTYLPHCCQLCVSALILDLNFISLCLPAFYNVTPTVPLSLILLVLGDLPLAVQIFTHF
jgi:hypothetical protein